MKRIVCLGLLIAASALPAWAADQRVNNFTLSDVQNQPWSLEAKSSRKLLVVAFLGTECPLAKLYGPRLAKLAEQYQSRGVEFIAINSNSHDSLTETAAYAKQAGFKFPMLKDVGNRIADQFQAERTPEVFVLDASNVVRYRGRIDDQTGVGYSRNEPTRRDLQIALDELLDNKPVSVAKTAPAGCHIGRVHKPQADAQVTYSKQISRLLNQRCVECHRDGEIAPFSLTKYEEVAGWAETIAEVVAEERMPPWHADPKFGKFADDRRLTSEEKQLIRDWARAGAPQGDPKDMPEPPKFPTAGWQIDREPDLVIPMSSKPYLVKADGELKYQFFPVPTGFKEDKWIRAIEVLPGNRQIVHHALVLERSGANQGGAEGFLAAYVPGLRAKAYPDGMAKRVSAGAQLIFQMHYTPNGVEQSDLTRLGIWFAKPDDIKHEVRTVSALTRNFTIPPQADNHPVEARTHAAPVDGTQLLAFMPHMHLRGKAFRYDLMTSGEPETLLDIPRYDFNWQTAYRLPEPRAIPIGASIRVTAHYDNSENNLNNPDPNATVKWGDQTYEEMMIGYIDIAIPRGTDSRAPASPPRIGNQAANQASEVIKNLDRNKDGNITRDEVPERFMKIFDRVAQGKNSVPVKDLQELIGKLR